MTSIKKNKPHIAYYLQTQADVKFMDDYLDKDELAAAQKVDHAPAEINTEPTNNLV